LLEATLCILMALQIAELLRLLAVPPQVRISPMIAHCVCLVCKAPRICQMGTRISLFAHAWGLGAPLCFAGIGMARYGALEHCLASNAVRCT